MENLCVCLCVSSCGVNGSVHGNLDCCFCLSPSSKLLTLSVLESHSKTKYVFTRNYFKFAKLYFNQGCTKKLFYVFLYGAL